MNDSQKEKARQHPLVLKYLRENARRGGRAGSHANKVKAGKIGAAKRNADKLRCKSCLQVVTPERVKQLKIKTVKTDKPI